MPDYYDKHGLPISMEEWMRRFEDDKYKRVAYTDFGPAQVSTVWLGIDHNFSRLFSPHTDQRPVIFETMLFLQQGATMDEDDGTLSDCAQARYATLEEAIAGHERMVSEVRNRILPAEAYEWLKDVLTEINRD